MVMVEELEGLANVIVIVEATERQHLAKLTIQALALVETMTEHLCLLSTKERLNTINSPKVSLVGGGGGKRRS